MSDKFYPQLSNIVSLDSLPEQISFIEGGLQQIFSNLHYRNYQVSQSSDKITTTRNLELVSFEELKVPILGTGIVLSFNSDFQSGGESYIPLSITTSLGIRKYIRNFNISEFTFSPEAIFNILLSIVNISNEDIILGIVSKNMSISNTPLDDIVSSLTNSQGLSISLPLDSNFETALYDLLLAIENQGINITQSLFIEYLIATNIEDTTEVSHPIKPTLIRHKSIKKVA